MTLNGKKQTVTPSEIGRLINGDAFRIRNHSSPITVYYDAVQRFLPRMNIFSAKKRYDKKRYTNTFVAKLLPKKKKVAYVIEQATKAVNVGDTAAILYSICSKKLSTS